MAWYYIQADSRAPDRPAKNERHSTLKNEQQANEKNSEVHEGEQN